jgi:hypothetical protein
MIEHKPWRGLNYESGINGQRVAIVGHSHHSNENDTENLTLDVISDIVSKQQSYKFFDQIRDYFGFQDSADFWKRVMFFNYLPDSVGTDDERYKFGTEEQFERGKERFWRILMDYRPQKVFVFSRTVWPKMKPLREEEATDSSGEIKGDGFAWGTYDVDGRIVMVFNLQHPERASKERQTRAVQQILAMPLQR